MPESARGRSPCEKQAGQNRGIPLIAKCAMSGAPDQSRLSPGFYSGGRVPMVCSGARETENVQRPLLQPFCCDNNMLHG